MISKSFHDFLLHRGFLTDKQYMIYGYEYFFCRGVPPSIDYVYKYKGLNTVYVVLSTDYRRCAHLKEKNVQKRIEQYDDQEIS